MYEGPIKAIDFAGCEEAPILRQLRWTDLVARIAATREVRPAPDGGASERPASFASFHLDSGHDGQQSVNPDALMHGKSNRLSKPDAANTAGDGDRETQ